MTRDNLKISVITVSYNSRATLRDTIESVLSQTYDDIEYIVVDGASTDGTVDIIRESEPRFGGRMRWVSEPDKGLYDAMNKGFAMATGDVVGILNSDDFYTSPDVLSTVAARMGQGDVDAVYADVHYVAHDDVTRMVRYYTSSFFRRWMMCMGFMPAHPSFYCRRAVYARYGDFDTSFRVAADFENLLRLLYIGRIRTAYIPKDFVTMRVGGVTTSGLRSHLAIMRDHLRALRKNRLPSSVFLLALRYPYKLAEKFFSVAWRRRK